LRWAALYSATSILYIGAIDNFDIDPAINITILALEGVFDTGLATVLDALTTANELGALHACPGPQFQISIAAVRARVRSAQQLRVPVMSLRDCPRPDCVIVPAMGYEHDPAGLGVVLKDYGARWPDLPLTVTESGIATHVGARRAEVVVRALEQIDKAKKEGADVRGYYHWSVYDNFEWALGFTPRFGLYSVDMTTYSAILNRYGCASGPGCEQSLRSRIQQADRQLNRDYLVVLASAAMGFLLLAAGRHALTRASVVVLMLFCIVMLVGGVLSPMLEVEVRITRLDATLLGSPIQFNEQSMYYRSKTVLEVSRSLIEMHRPAMSLVAVLVILFSVVFPTLKMLALSFSLFRPSLLRTSRIMRLLAFDLSKWSMADVMVLAIFMSFIAFNGVIESGLGGIRTEPAIQQLVLPTNSSQILPGYYLFIGFCVGSIYLSKKLERGIASDNVSSSI